MRIPFARVASFGLICIFLTACDDSGDDHDGVASSIGKFAYTANNGSGNVSGFTINPTTGVLTPIPGNPPT
jgi:hypothetical protein